MTWGLGAFADVSYRVLFAELGDQVAAGSCSTVSDVAVAFAHRYWATYSGVLHVQIERARRLRKLSSRTTAEEAELEALIESLRVGFCIAGYLLPDRRVRAFELVFSPILDEVPAPRELQSGEPSFWGVPLVMNRVTFGIDTDLLAAIGASPHWTGSSRQLVDLIEPFVLRLAANLPIREAIDYIHSVIVTTSKGLKFSQLPPLCGGRCGNRSNHRRQEVSMGQAQDARRGTRLITRRERAEEFERALMKIATRPGPPLSPEQVRAIVGSSTGRVTVATLEDVARERRSREADPSQD